MLNTLFRLKRIVFQAFLRNQLFVIIFFNFEKGYNIVWQHWIIDILHKMRVQRQLSKFILPFLRDCRFSLRVCFVPQDDDVLHGRLHLHTFRDWYQWHRRWFRLVSSLSIFHSAFSISSSEQVSPLLNTVPWFSVGWMTLFSVFYKFVHIWFYIGTTRVWNSA